MSQPAEGLLSVQEIQMLLDRSPFLALLSLRVERLDHEKQEITIRMPLAPAIERRPGTKQVHGGAMAALIDTVGDFAVGMLVGGGVPTINFRTDFLRPAIDTDLVATATVRRLGRTVAVVDVDVFSSNGKLLAVGRGSYSPTAG